MSKSTHDVPSIPRSEVRDSLTEVFREGARTMLITALNAEIAEYVEQFAHLVDEEGRRLVVRNGYQRERNLQTPIGEIPVERPGVNDRRVAGDGDRCRFTVRARRSHPPKRSESTARASISTVPVTRPRIGYRRDGNPEANRGREVRLR